MNLFAVEFTAICLVHSDGTSAGVFAHEGRGTAFRAGARINILEALQLEKLARHLYCRCQLCLDGVIGVSLCVSQRNLRWAFAHVLDSRDVSVLQIASSLFTEVVGHDNTNGRLWAKTTTIGELRLRQVH